MMSDSPAGLGLFDVFDRIQRVVSENASRQVENVVWGVVSDVWVAMLEQDAHRAASGWREDGEAGI